MTDYEKRKWQLEDAMRAALAKTDYGFYFDNDRVNRKVFYPIFRGSPREEFLSEIFVDDDERIVVHTWYKDGCDPNHPEREDIEITPFDEFSDEEMETIMRLAGVPIP